jgi:hypothetical protein
MVVFRAMGRPLVMFVYTPEYAQHVDVLLWLMIVGVVQCFTTCFGGALTAAAQFRVQVPLFVAVTVISLIGCLVLVPRMGLVGATLELKPLSKFSRETACLSVDARRCSISTLEMECAYLTGRPTFLFPLSYPDVSSDGFEEVQT